MTTWSVPSLPSHFNVAGHPRFVGRRHELESLERVWELVEKGQRQAVFLGGEPGSGKSRIAAEMGRALHVQDAAVLVGRNSADLGYPYEPFVEALNHLLTATDEGSLAHLIPSNAAELLRVTPHLRRHRPDLEDPPESRSEYRRELFGAYVDLMEAVAVERPVAIFVEDLHWSSSPTRLLLSYLIESTQESRILVLATWRNTAPDRTDELSYALADLHRLPGVSRLDLSGLALEDVESYLRAEVGSRVPHLRESAALLRDQTGGNPFFLREIWRDVTQSGGVQALRSQRVSPPQSVRDSLDKRIRSFDPATRVVLEHAAVLGSELSVIDVIEALRGTVEEPLRALDQAVAAGLMNVVTGGRYAFQHALIRQALIDSLAPSRSAQIHARMAETVSFRYESEPELAPLLARLYDGARALGYREQLVHYLSEAAESARRGLAYEEASQLWERAAAGATQDAPQRDSFLLSAARAHMLAGAFPEARRIYREVNSSPDPETALRAAIGFEEASWRPGTLGHQARALLESSIERIPADPENPLYVSALISLGRSHTFSGDLDSAGRIGAQALEMARHLGDDSLIADALAACLLRVINLPITRGDFSDLSVELRSIVMRTGDYDRLGTAGTQKASTAYANGNPRAFHEGWDDIHLAADKTGQPFWRWVDGCYRYCHEFISGDFDAATASAVSINELGYSFGADEAEGPFGLQIYMVKREMGDLDEVRDLITGNPAKDGTWTPGLLSLYTELEMRDSVKSLLPSVMALPETNVNRMAVYPAVVAFLAEAAMYVDDTSAVERLLPIVAEYDGLNLLVGQCVAVFGSANTYLGRMHAALGDLEKAESHLRKALQMDVAVGSTVHQATSLAYYAQLKERTGEAGLAADYREKARQFAAPIGQTRVLRLLEGPGGRLYPNGLTEREIEVLRLLVEGASNKQIGDRLFISTNTAANHVRNILNKTGSANRTAAAIYATERNLA